MRIMLREYHYQAGFLHMIDEVLNFPLGEPSVEIVSPVLGIRMTANTLRNSSK